MGFQVIINNITTYLQDIADSIGLPIRYDNDPRETPTENLWCEASIDFDDSKQKAIGAINSYRNAGNLVIKIHHSVGKGVWFLLRIVDRLVARFTEKTINDSVKFQIPKVRNVGRESDDYEFNIICPFYVDN